jgi:ketosteroid isomerase-like protein
MTEVEHGVVAGPVEAFERFRELVLDNGTDGLESLLAVDAVVESPFAAPGVPARFEGRAAFMTMASRRAAVTEHIRFTAVRELAVHSSTDPEVAVVEYEMEAVRLTDGFRATAPFAVVVRVRDGQVVLWREYQNPAVMALVMQS